MDTIVQNTRGNERSINNSWKKENSWRMIFVVLFFFPVFVLHPMLGKRTFVAGDGEREEKKKKIFDLHEVEPFQSFVSFPPVVYFSHYAKLTGFLQAQISDYKEDQAFIVEDLPIDLLSELGLVEDATFCWRSIVTAVADDVTSLWDRIQAVDHIICLTDLHENSPLILEAQHEVWWIKQVETWFSTIETDYIQLGMNAIILESFYRFVWARFTYQVYQTQRTTPPSAMDEDIKPQSSVCKNEGTIYDIDDENFSESEQEEETEEENRMPPTPPLSLPKVVDLFFLQKEISECFDDIESQYFDRVTQEGTEYASVDWDMEPAIDLLITLAQRKSAEEAKKFSQAKVKSKKELLLSILSPYLSKHIPFLRKMGLFIHSDEPFKWRWSSFIPMPFVDGVYISMFRNLNENGIIERGQQFTRLFPSLLMVADSGTQVHIPRVAGLVEDMVSSYDTTIPELNDIVSTLTKVIEERNTLVQSVEDPMPSAVLKILGGSKMKRIEQLENIINELQQEFHRLTSSIDATPSKKREVKPILPKKKKTIKNGLFPSEFVLSADSVFDMLHAATMDEKSVTLSLGSTDISILLAARCFYASPIGSYGCSISERKVAGNRISTALKHEQEIIKDSLNASLLSTASPEDVHTSLVSLIPGIQALPLLENLVFQYRSAGDEERPILSQKMFQLLKEALRSSFVPQHSHTVSSMIEALTNVKDKLLTEQTLCIITSSSFLWDLTFKEANATLFSLLEETLQQFPSRCKILLVNKLECKEYANNIWKYIPWNVECHGRLLEYDTYQEEDQNTVVYKDTMDWFFNSLKRQGNSEEKKVIQSYKRCIRDYYVLYPSARSPIFPHPFATSSIHVTSSHTASIEETDNISLCHVGSQTPRSWTISFRQKMSNSMKRSGTSLSGVWDMERSKSYQLFPHNVFRKRKLWESILYRTVVLGGLTAEETVQWLIGDAFMSTGVLRELLFYYEGLFLISDHPGRCFIISTISCADHVRFYTVEQDAELSGASGERPSSFPQDKGEWKTMRMAIPPMSSLHCKDKIVKRMIQIESQEEGTKERVWKYCLAGNKEFWQYFRDTSISNLNHLRSTIEARFLFEDIDNIVLDRSTGPIPADLLLPEIAGDAVQVVNQSRLISPFEEWFYEQPPSDIQHVKEMVALTMMNISLYDSANWQFWDKRYDLSNPNHFSKFTAPDCVPSQYVEQCATMQSLCDQMPEL